MILILGIGNPGSEYTQTYHNLGFEFIDILAKKFAPGLQFSSGKYGLFLKCYIYEKLCIVVKPNTYVNLSGKATEYFMHYYSISPENVIVAHDDIELPFLTIKLKKGTGTAGHRGLKSIALHVKSEYHRVRLGVSRPESCDIASYVLKKISCSKWLEYSQKISLWITANLENIDVFHQTKC